MIQNYRVRVVRQIRHNQLPNMIMLLASTHFVETPSTQTQNSQLDSFFTTSRTTSGASRSAMGLQHLACTSCMSTLTADACCAECGREFEP